MKNRLHPSISNIPLLWFWKRSFTRSSCDASM